MSNVQIDLNVTNPNAFAIDVNGSYSKATESTSTQAIRTEYGEKKSQEQQHQTGMDPAAAKDGDSSLMKELIGLIRDLIGSLTQMGAKQNQPAAAPAAAPAQGGIGFMDILTGGATKILGGILGSL